MTDSPYVTNGLGATSEELADAPNFGRKRQRNLFYIDDDLFEAAPGLPVDQGMEFVHLAEQWQVDDPERAKALARELFSKVLLPESLERFSARMGDMERPVELTQLPEIITWLLERFGFRPTPEESSASSTGSASPAAGTNSEAASSSQALIPLASPSTVP
jgi:hypothetical protein